MSLVFSYLRFSSEKQSSGHSRDRQKGGAEEYCSDHSLTLDPRTFEDLGVSAWKGKNAKFGALRGFLDAVDSGSIPSDATLIVESLDRISRAKPMDALGLFTEIINRGITIITLMDKAVLNRDTLHKDQFLIMKALMAMSLANDESEKKSNRLLKLWASRRDKAIANREVMTAKAPMWLITHGKRPTQTFSIDPEREPVMKLIIDLARQGNGNTVIIKHLVQQGIKPWIRSLREKIKRDEKAVEAGRIAHDRVWGPSLIQKFLSSPALYGAVQVKTGELIRDYYPPLMTEGEFILMSAERAARSKSKSNNRKGDKVTNLFSGLLVCGYCKSRMGISGYRSKSGRLAKYFACYGSRSGATDCRMHGWDTTEFEDDVLFSITQLDYGSLVGNKINSLDVERQQLALFAKSITDAQSKINNLIELLETSASPTLIKRVDELEAELVKNKTLHSAQDKKVATLIAQDSGGTNRMSSLVKLFRALKRPESDLALRTIREQLSSLVHQMVARIVMYPVGRTAHGSRTDRFVDVTFVSGSVRRIEGAECSPKELEIVVDN